jgi:GTP-binding protein
MGRSNVGKSSLLNRLLGRRALARVSKTPGRTREIHFYSVDEGLYLVDLPGFGFARVSRSERVRWAKMVEGYLDSGAPLALALQLVDARHEPTALDRMLADFLTERGLPRLVVLTKADKLSGSELPRALSRTRRALGLGREDQLVATSARSGRGMNELSSSIASAIGKDERRKEGPS